jgi:hypothetical protein
LPDSNFFRLLVVNKWPGHNWSLHFKFCLTRILFSCIHHILSYLQVIFYRRSQNQSDLGRIPMN